MKHSCDVAYNSDHDANPADFDDSTWLDSFYSIDGKNVVALGHMEYHGCINLYMALNKATTRRHAGITVTRFTSDRRRLSLRVVRGATNYILSPPYRYIVNAGPEGYSIDTNVVKSGDRYYAMVTGWGWPANCSQGESNCLVYGGEAPIRASDITDPTSWQGWNGTDYS